MNSWKKKPRLLHKQPVMNAMKLARVIEADTMIETFTTTSGDVTLHMPRLKGISFETAVIERYRRRESSVEEALIEMYLAGVSV